MNPGKLNKRITILEQVATQNGYGENDHTWAETVTLWANVRTLTGRALFQAQQVQAEISSKVIIRYRSDIKSNMRIKYGSRTLEIIFPVNMNEENRYLELSCKELI
jgi:SPP1 family predicted phage head-tail adaptor